MPRTQAFGGPGPTDPVEVGTEDFSGGLVTLKPAHLIDETQCQACHDVDFTRSLGAITRRYGRILNSAINNSDTGVSSGLFEFIDETPNTHIYQVVGNFIYEWVSTSTVVPVYYAYQTGSTFGAISVASVENTGIGTRYIINTTGNHGFNTGDSVMVYGYVGGLFSSVINGNTYTIDAFASNAFYLNGSSGTSAGPTVDTCTNTWTVDFTINTAPPLGLTNFTTFNGLCIAVSPEIPTLKNLGQTTNSASTANVGSAFQNLLGTPPANGQFVETWKNRVFIYNSSAGTSRLSFCVAGNPEDWTTQTGTASDSGYIDVGKFDGDIGTGIAGIGYVMIMWKNNSTWMISGGDPTNFSVRQVSPLVGCVSPRGYVKCDQFAMYLSAQGVYNVTANGNGVVLVSYNINPTLYAVPFTSLQTAIAGRWKTQFWICPDGVNTYVLDWVLGMWSIYNFPTPVRCMYTRLNGTLMAQGFWYDHTSGAYTDGMYLYNYQQAIDYDNGRNHSGTTTTAITAFWQSKDWSFQKWPNTKMLHDLVGSFTPYHNNTSNPPADVWSITYYLNGVPQTYGGWSTEPSGSEDREVLKDEYHYQPTAQSQYISFGFSTLGESQLLGYSALAEIREREMG